MRKPDRIAFLFPGQGSQQVGMGRDVYLRFPEVRKTFEQARGQLGVSVERLCFEGPADELQRTENCQLAVFVLSVAIARVLEAHGISPSAVAGHSVGEYAALVGAGALDFDHGCSIVRTRGLLMGEACARVPGGMVAIVGLPLEIVEAICSEAIVTGGAGIANHNSPDQFIVSGEVAAVELVARNARLRGALRATVLPVSGAFHSRLMAPAQAPFADAVARLPLKAPRIPVVSSVTATPIADPATIRKCAVEQITAPVRWTESVQWLLRHGATTFVEVGPGRVLSSLVRAIATSAEKTVVAHHTSTAQVLDQALASLWGEPYGAAVTA